MQLVHLVRSGDRAQMSKRAGEFVTLDDLVAEIGVDAARWYLLARSHDTTVDLDLDLAASSQREPGLLRAVRARPDRLDARRAPARQRVERRWRAAGHPRRGAAPLHASERALVKRLLAFPGEVAEAVARRAPHRIAAYALELAQGFTAFYRRLPGVGAEPGPRSSRSGSRCRVASMQHDVARAWICSVWARRTDM